MFSSAVFGAFFAFFAFFFLAAFLPVGFPVAPPPTIAPDLRFIPGNGNKYNSGFTWFDKRLWGKKKIQKFYELFKTQKPERPFFFHHHHLFILQQL
jgi:hypothetical protein